jgi:hypothetical protein
MRGIGGMAEGSAICCLIIALAFIDANAYASSAQLAVVSEKTQNYKLL